MGVFDKITKEVKERAEEEAQLLQAAVEAGRHTGDGPADVAEPVEAAEVE